MGNRNRRGMLLLVVLALLALFAMMSVAFVVMTGAALSSSKKVQQIEVQYDSPQKQLNDAVKIVVNGTTVTPSQANNSNYCTNSAITWQSLLEKEYGFETIGTLANSCTLSYANITQVCTPTGGTTGQLLEFYLPQTNPGVDVYLTSAGTAVSVDPFHCVGCVLTMLDGPAAGLSTRIVAVDPTAPRQPGYAWPPVQVMAFEGGVQPATPPSTVPPPPPVHYIINGFPYSGMGFGYSGATGGLNNQIIERIQSSQRTQTVGPIVLALSPNSPPGAWGAVGGTNGIIPGGVNGDSTVADYSDPLTALAVSDGSGGVFVPIPSLHRSDLIAYQMTQNHINSFNSNNVGWLRTIMFRPNPIDHPNFTGSNPSNTFTASNGVWNASGGTWDGNVFNNPNGYQWDVDNMGRGRPDSVWVDLGMPVRYTSDGKAYKPLFAILCLDMDGRLNLNAHGNLAQTSQNYYKPQNVQSYSGQSLNIGFNSSYQVDAGPFSTWGAMTGGTGTYAGGAPAPPVPLLRGQGTGPAEVNLLPLFRNLATPTSFNATNYQYLLWGGNGMTGRYGGSALPGTVTGSTSGSLLTWNNAFTYSSVLWGGTQNYWNVSGGSLDAYGAPPDPQAAGAIGLDNAGRLIRISMGGRVANGPYDFDITRNAPHAVDFPTNNNALGVAEMEHILRWPDRDATTLPTRLANLTTASGGTSLLNARCAEFTVESNNVPVSAAALPPELRFTINAQTRTVQPLLPNCRSVHPVDIIYAQIYKNYPGNLQLAQSAALQLLPWEVLEGLKMDVNRPFGAGAFSLPGAGDLSPTYGGAWNKTGKSQVLPDQPGMGGETLTQYVNGSGGTVSANFNYSADAGVFSQNPPIPSAGVTTTTQVLDSMAARQLYARHLYVLALSLCNTGAVLADLKAASPNANPAPTGDDVCRFLAQWAVNVVAYRDHNNIMIPFYYDVSPFTLNRTTNRFWNPDYTVQHTVWGCKRPELVITETLAMHDRRTSDETTEDFDSTKMAKDNKTWTRTQAGSVTDSTTSKKKDPSFNSKYRPQGSLFVELFNPWPAAEPHTPDLAPSKLSPASAQSQPGVELTKVTPATAAGASSPVWRMIIVDPTKQVTPLGQPDTAVLNPNADELPDPDNPKLDTNFPPTLQVLARPIIERVAYFVPLQNLNYPPKDDRGNVVVNYYPSTTSLPAGQSVVVPPGGYAVVGSGDPKQGNRTYVGFPTSGAPPAGPPRITTRCITLNPADVTAADPRVIKSSVDVTRSFKPPQVLGIDSPQRLSISEPLKGYTKYEGLGPHPASYNSTTGQYSPILDIPVDQQRDLSGDEKGIWKILNNDGVVSGYRYIYLQRLADPTRPYVPEGGADPRICNPYRTVDAMSVDLSCFNGVAASSGLKTTKDPTTTGGWTATVPPGTPYFESHQRGELNYQPATAPAANAVGAANLWKQEPVSKSNTTYHWPGSAITGQCFNQPINHTLGFLNQPYGSPSANPVPGDPQYPFPLLHWAYRPFNNVYELLLVPTVSSSRLLARKAGNLRGYYGYVDEDVRRQTEPNANTYTPQNVYNNGAGASQLPYPHLLNFFESSPPVSTSATQSTSAQFYRLLYYLGVPSRFANTQLQVQAYNAGLNSTTKPRQQGPAHSFHTPFNRISRYREPGLINLNTVASSDVLFGAINAYCSPLAVYSNAQLNPVFWDKFVRSRRGDTYVNSNAVTSQLVPQMPPPSATSAQIAQFYQQLAQLGQRSVTNMLTINPSSPSRFTRPYRTPGGASLAPFLPNKETDDTLLRGDPDSTERPLYEMDDYLMGTTASNVGGTPDQFPLASMDFNRGARFRYQLMQKLGSTVSTHSNVFAIWITVGYFEVTPAPNGVDPGHPDGWQLGQELGADTGDVTRHRAFFIFDRSLPVGFIRGQDINSDKAFLLKRFIE